MNTNSSQMIEQESVDTTDSLTKVANVQQQSVTEKIPLDPEINKVDKMCSDTANPYADKELAIIQDSDVCKTGQDSSSLIMPSSVVENATEESQTTISKTTEKHSDSGVTIFVSNGHIEESSHVVKTVDVLSATNAFEHNHILSPKEEGNVVKIQIKTLEAPGTLALNYLSRTMFAAGDSEFPPLETVQIVHTYINVWMTSLLLRFFITFKRGYPTSKDKQAVWKDRKFSKQLTSFLKAVYPLEMKKYSKSTVFHKLAVSSNNATSNLSRRSSDNFVEVAPDDFEADNSSLNLLYTYDDVKLREILIPPERFEQRLRFRDVRTQNLTSREYSQFTKAREKSLVHSRAAFNEWLVSCANLGHDWIQERPIKSSRLARSALSTKENKKETHTVPKLCEEQMFFLVNDRVLTVVEFALRIEYVMKEKKNEADANKKLSIQEIPPFDAVIDRIYAQDLQFKDNYVPKSAHAPVSLEPYQIATQMLFDNVDASVLHLEGFYNELEMGNSKNDLKSVFSGSKKNFCATEDNTIHPPESRSRKRRALGSSSESSLNSQIKQIVNNDDVTFINHNDNTMESFDEKQVFAAVVEESLKKHKSKMELPDEFSVYYYFNSSGCMIHHMKQGSALSVTAKETFDIYLKEKRNETPNYLNHLQRYKNLCSVVSLLRKIESLAALATGDDSMFGEAIT